jgi:hypothetical protein
MSQPVSPPPSVPMPDGSFVLGLAEIALLAQLGGRLPLVLPSLPEQEDAAWMEVLDQVVERGLLRREGDDVSVRDDLAAFLGPIAESDFAMEATVRDESRTWMAAQSHVVECVPVAEGAVRVTPVPFDSLEGRVAEFLGFAGPVRGVDGVPVDVPADQMAVAVEQVDQGVAVDIPSAPQFAAAMTSGDLRRTEVRWIEDGAVHGARYEWVDVGDDGVWAAEGNEDGVVTVQPRATTSLWEGISGLLP